MFGDFTFKSTTTSLRSQWVNIPQVWPFTTLIIKTTDHHYNISAYMLGQYHVCWCPGSSQKKSTDHDDVIKWKRNSALLALCGIHRLPLNFLHKDQWQSFDVFFDLCLNKQFSKQSWGWWFEMPLHSLWRYCNVLTYVSVSWRDDITGSGNDLSPIWHHAITLTNDDIFSVGP